MKKTILFDLDGTLIDSTKSILSGFEYAFKSHNIVVPDHNLIKSLIGYTLEDIFLRLSVPSHMIDSCVSKYKEKYQDIYLDQTTLLPSVDKALEIASKFASLGIVTTKGSKALPELLDRLKIKNYFDVLIGRNDVKNPKPDAEPINLALKQLGKDDSKSRSFAYMVGDTPLDIIAAKSAGIKPISVLCGYANFELLSSYNTAIFDTTLDAVKYISQLN